MFKTLFLSIVLSSVLSSFAFADTMGANGDKFYEEAAHLENACDQASCAAPYSRDVTFNHATLNKLTAEVKTRLKQIAIQQAQIWGDTILEGDFYADGQTRLDQVVALYKDTTLIGYKIKYSEKAWNTANCSYTGSPETLKTCPQGRISEETYVSGDTQTFFGDEDKRAQFSFSGN